MCRYSHRVRPDPWGLSGGLPLLPEKRHYIRSLRISKEVERSLLRHLDAEDSKYAGQNRRRDERCPYRLEDGLYIRLTHPGGIEANLLVIPRNISQNGMAFLHGSYVHPGSECTVLLQSLDGELMQVHGEVIRCTHVRGTVHEVAVLYDQPIELSWFLHAYLRDDKTDDESTQLGGLLGRILYIEDSPDDRELVSFLLRKHGAELRTVPNLTVAINLLNTSSFDVVLTDLNLPEICGTDVITAIRKTGFTGPVLAVTAEEDPDLPADVMQAGCNEVLIKPYSFDALLDLLRRHLPEPKKQEQDADPVKSSMWSDVHMRPLILRFLERLEEKTRRIEKALQAEDRAQLQSLCHDLKGSAKGYGYNEITRIAREVQQLATAGLPFRDLRAKADELTSLCHSACQARVRSRD